MHFKRSLGPPPTLQSHLKMQNKAADERLNRRGKVGTPDLASSRICQMKGGGSGVGCSPEHAWPNTSNAPLPTIYTTYTHCWPHSILVTIYTTHLYCIHPLAHNIHNTHTADHSKLITLTAHRNIYTTHTHDIHITRCLHSRNYVMQKSWLIFKCKTCIIVDKI